MAKSKLRGGAKAHNIRIKARNEKIKGKEWEFEMLKKKIYEEAKARYEEEQNKPTELKITTDDGHNNS
jgi:hypothetical protein